MNVLVACEFSGVVREAFRRRGHNAWSCDLEAVLDDSAYHLRADVLDVLRRSGRSWELAARPRVDSAPLQGKLRWEVTA